MSWGYFAKLTFELSSSAWARVRATKLPAGTWPRSTVADYFVPAEWGEDTVEELLERPWRASGDPSVLGVSKTKADGKVTISLFASVDRGQDLIYEVGCLPRALDVVAKAGGSGTLDVVNDGSTDAPSWGWRSAGGKLRMNVMSDRREAELLATYLEAIGVEEEVAKPRKSPRGGANKLPQLARLDEQILEVQYQPALEPQLLEVVVHGSPKFTWISDYPARMHNAMLHWAHGAGGGQAFPPEATTVELIAGKLPDGTRIPTPPDGKFAWTFRVAALDARAFVPALRGLADAWSVSNNLQVGADASKEPQFYPRRISLIGEQHLGADGIRTAEVLGWIRARAEQVAAYGELPFLWTETSGTSKLVVVTKRRASKAKASELAYAVVAAADVAALHSKFREARWPNVVAQASRITLTWPALDCPMNVLRGPLQNALRWFHHRVAPVIAVTWSS